MLTGENMGNNDSPAGQNPWQGMVSEMPSFEDREAREMSLYENPEYVDVSRIDILTDEGKYEWLDSLVANSITMARADLDKAISVDDEQQIADITHRLNHAERQQKMLNNLFNSTADGDILERLRENYRNFSQFNDNLSVDATEEAKQLADVDFQAASDLSDIMESEVIRRDPNYFGEAEIRTMLFAQIDQAEKAVDDSKITVDGYYGEDGFVHKVPSGGEKQPTATTEDAEINLREAKQDAETFRVLMQDYSASVNFQVPRAIRKLDFAPTITNFIENRTTQINQLLEASRALAKDTPEYIENTEARKQLAKERRSASRLRERYFSALDTSSDTDDGMTMEELPANKTPKQIEAERSARRRKEEAEFKQRMQEYMEQRDAEQRRREQSERATAERKQAEEKRRERIKAAEEKVRQAYHQQEQEDGQEMEMEM